MSNLKTYFKNVVSVCKKGFAYVRAISVLVKATYQRMVVMESIMFHSSRLVENGIVKCLDSRKNCLSIH